MSIINLIRTSVYSLRKHKVRLFLTMIGIIIGISSVVTILSIGDGLKAEVNKSAATGSINKISIVFDPEQNNSYASGFMEAFNEGDIEEVSEIDGVEKVEVQNGLGVAMLGDMTFANSSFFDKSQMSSISKYDDKPLKLLKGRTFGKDESGVIILSYEDCENLFESPDYALGKAITIMGEYYEVIGIQEKATFDFNSIMSLGINSSYLVDEDYKKLNMEGKQNSINAIDIVISTEKDKKAVGNEVIDCLKNAHKELNGTYKIQDPNEMTKAFSKIIDAIAGFIAVVSGISLFVAGIGVMNIMYVSISERKREIGIRRAIGAHPNNILLQFLIEAVIVTILGGLLGLGFGIILSKIIGIFMPFKPVLTLRTVLISVITSVLTGMIFGVVPANKAAKLPPIQAIYQ